MTHNLISQTTRNEFHKILVGYLIVPDDQITSRSILTGLTSMLATSQERAI